MNEINKPTSKVYCDACDCMVVAENHAERCRPKQTRGWTSERSLALLGDVVQRMDVMLALNFMAIPKSQWSKEMLAYTSNDAMAQYMRSVISCDTTRSDHTLGTWFEAAYVGEFRETYLRTAFPSVCDRVLMAWVPPSVDGWDA